MARTKAEGGISGLQKAAILLISLGPERSAGIFKHLKEEEIEEAYTQVDRGLIEIIRKALKNIETYHEKQRQYSWFDSKPDGTILGQKVTALDRVGVYVPGGKAAYPSSVLMNIVPAKTAGVREIIMVTPPGKDGKVTPTTLVAAKEAGADKICSGFYVL